MIFESTPDAYSSVNDPILYVVYDAHATNPTTYPNYKYVAEIWINGTQVFTGKYFPNPTTSRGIIDASNVIREYVSAILLPTSTGIVAQQLIEGQWKLSVVVKIREEYGGTIGAVILTDSTRTMFNHYNGRIYGVTILSNYTNKPLSDRGLIIDMTLNNANYFIPYFATTTSTYNVVITGGTSTRTKVVTPSAANSMQILNISPAAINSEYAGNFTSSTTFYTVLVSGITYRVNLQCEGLYDNYVVHFMNKYGGYESMLFNKVSKKYFDLEKKSYKQLPYRISSSGVSSVGAGITMYQQNTDYAGRVKERLKMNTDWVSDLDYEWLSQLIISPQVWVEEDGKLFPAMISQSNYEFKKHIVDALINVSIDVEFSSSFKTQYQ